MVSYLDIGKSRKYGFQVGDHISMLSDLETMRRWFPSWKPSRHAFPLVNHVHLTSNLAIVADSTRLLGHAVLRCVHAVQLTAITAGLRTDAPAHLQ